VIIKNKILKYKIFKIISDPDDFKNLEKIEKKVKNGLSLEKQFRKILKEN